MASKKMMFAGNPVLILFTMFFRRHDPVLPEYPQPWIVQFPFALILPGAVSVYNSIICKTASEAMPDSLMESAYIDGANDLTILFRIVAPLIKPTMAVLLLYHGVDHWNSWFNASIYLQDNSKLLIQNIMRAILIANSNVPNSAAAENDQGEPVCGSD